jgi:hypothetical protein
MDHNELVFVRQSHFHEEGEIGFKMAGDSNTDSGKACAEFVCSALSTISSLLERLIFVASLRDPATGDYNERLLALKFGRANVEDVLAAEHMDIFEAWLCLNLEKLTIELELHLSNQEAPLRAVLGEWMHLKPYESLIPAGAMHAQRELFLTDMETILRTLARKTGSNVAPIRPVE